MYELICFQEKERKFKQIHISQSVSNRPQLHKKNPKSWNKSSVMFSVFQPNEILKSTLKPGTFLCYSLKKIAAYQWNKQTFALCCLSKGPTFEQAHPQWIAQYPMNHKLKHVTLASAANPTSAVCLTIMRGWENQKLGLGSQPENLISLLKSRHFSHF